MPDQLTSDLDVLLADVERRRDEKIAAAAKLLRDKPSTAAKLNAETLVRESVDLECDARLFAEIRDSAPRIKVKSEPLTYTKQGGESYLRDLAIFVQGPTPEVAKRLHRHQAEMDVELPRLDARAQRAAHRRLDERGIEPTYELRAASTYAGAGGSFAPPLWIVEEFASINRAARPTANLIGAIPLPEHVSSVNVPQVTAGTSVGVQDANNAAVTTLDITDAALKSSLTTIAGFEDVSLPMLEQTPAPGLDVLLYRDLINAYDATLEQQVIAGTGSSDQLAGLQNVSGATTVTYTSGSPTGTGLYTQLGQLIAQTADARDLPVEALVMRPALWAYLAASQDSSDRPLSPPSTHQHLEQPVDEAYEPRLQMPAPVGKIAGVPVFLSGGVPANLGTGTNQTEVFALYPDDLLIWEGTPRFDVLLQPLSGTLGARIRLYNYVAFIPNRHAAGVGILEGTGLVVQSGY